MQNVLARQQERSKDQTSHQVASQVAENCLGSQESGKVIVSKSDHALVVIMSDKVACQLGQSEQILSSPVTSRTCAHTQKALARQPERLGRSDSNHLVASQMAEYCLGTQESKKVTWQAARRRCPTSSVPENDHKICANPCAAQPVGHVTLAVSPRGGYGDYLLGYAWLVVRNSWIVIRLLLICP